MSPANGRASTTRMRRAAPVSELCIVVGCHTFACAIPTRYVLRLVLNEDVNVVPGSGGRIVTSGGEHYAASNLGELLELAPLADAWVLLHMPTPRGPVPIALRTGPCLVVREVGVEAPLPNGLFKRRGDAVFGAFVAGAVRGFAENTLYGLVLNLGKLWSDAELEALRSTLAQAERKAPGG